jgi:hypothetical protein
MAKWVAVGVSLWVVYGGDSGWGELNQADSTRGRRVQAVERGKKSVEGKKDDRK